MRDAFGPILGPDGVRMRLWAPAAPSVTLICDDARCPMESLDGEWFEVLVPGATAGSRYAYEVGGLCFPDPASRSQPGGVHAPSEVIDPQAYAWSNCEWRGIAWSEIVLYELHVGAFTQEGTFRAAIERLDDVRALGVNAIELMPVAQATGTRGWGYDGVLPFAPSNNYGRPDDLKALIDAAHGKGIAVFLDVVYNHFGPEGNYLHHYAPAFFTDRYHTPWGSAINLDGPQSDLVRRFFIENARYWLEDFRFDGLRLDAVDQLRDASRRHVLIKLAEEVRSAIPPDRHVHLVLENDENAARLLRAGLFDAQWNDDAHHALHVALTGERASYYRDYPQPIRALGRALTEGFVYQGEASAHRGKKRGEPSMDLPPTAFVDFLQNHDQIGNRALGERITMLAPWEAVRAAAAIVLLAPSIPLLFMGEEWGASTPFLFFCDFSGDLARAVAEGRRAEFPGGPDPNDVATFRRSKLRWEERGEPMRREILTFYSNALAARRKHIVPLIGSGDDPVRTCELVAPRVIRAQWTFSEDTRLTLFANLGPQAFRHACCDGERIFAAGLRSGDVAFPPWSAEWSVTRGS
jgi:malto-oligosyltrehalose trehalohydrolase